MKKLLFIVKNFTIGNTLKFISWLHIQYANYLAESNGHWYHVFRIKWTFKILNVKEIDNRKIEGMRWAKRALRIKNATMHHTIDYAKYCIHIARPKKN
jgi:hypothetical protein